MSNMAVALKCKNVIQVMAVCSSCNEWLEIEEEEKACYQSAAIIKVKPHTCEKEKG